ncbi:MAG: cache domain-containing protein [Thermodesulfovibrionales bacterium]|nr:cache domain-containing protein [Thermodesulfovibrionales bacterium]
MEEKKLSLSGLRRLIIRLIERFCPFNVTLLQVMVGLFTAVMLLVVLILGWMSSTKVKEVVTMDFNQQQLVLAQHAAGQIENNLNSLKREMSLLSLSPSVQYSEAVFMGSRMGIAFSSIKDSGGLDIRFIEAGKPLTHMVDDHGYRRARPAPEDKYYLEWARRKENRGSTIISAVSPVIYGDGRHKLAMKMALPVYQVSVDETHRMATNKFSGVLIFLVDATGLIEEITKGIKSGKTGYAWVMDKNGIFLYHPESKFIGKDAFTAREEKKPTISFARINEIQKEMMLAGKEGTSWYISGWHKGVEGEMKKLIAYTPISLGGSSGQLWSVAVVAPISEVADAVHSIQVRQISLQAVIIAVILLGGMAVTYLIVNWSDMLSQEVEKKTAEVKKSEQRYMSLVENAEDVIFTVDCSGNYLSINRYGAQFLGSTPDGIIGRNLSEVLLWPSGEAMLMAVMDVFESKKGSQITHPVKIGEQEYWLNTNFRRLMDGEGNVYAVLGISRDITDRKKMEERSYHTEKLASMGTLAAGVAHEINNPLGIILGFTDLLLEKTGRGTEEHDMLETIEKHGLRAKRVVENLLSFARYSEYKEELVNINDNIKDVLSVVENTLRVNKIFLKQELQDGLPPVGGCAEELQQVFFNIITNAVSAMKKGGALTVATRSINGQQVEVRFADTGDGIRKEHRDRIFDPLFTTKKIGEGTGLGLSVSYGIIMKYGGTISFETKTEDESFETGTTFIITLPAAKTLTDKNAG